MILSGGIVRQWWEDPTMLNGAVGQQGRGGHSVRITNRQAVLKTNPSWSSSRQWVGRGGWDRLNAFAHSCNVGVGLLKNLMHILEFNVVSLGVLVVLNYRDSFCCAAKINGERGTVKVLCLYYTGIEAEYHNGGGDQRET